MSLIAQIISKIPASIVTVVGIVIAWKLQMIPGILKGLKGALGWASSKLWHAILEPKYRMVHRYYLMSLFDSPMRELGSSVKYRLLIPSCLRPEVRDPVFGRDISESAVLTIVAQSTVQRIDFRLETSVGATCTQDTFSVHTNGRSHEIQIARPVFPLDDFSYFTANPFIGIRLEIAAEVHHATHIEHCVEFMDPTGDEFWRGKVVGRDGRCYNITGLVGAREEIAERMVKALLSPGEVALSTNRENVHDLHKRVRRGGSLRWDTPFRRLIVAIITTKPLLELALWVALYRDQIDFSEAIPNPQLRWLKIFRVFRVDRVRPLVLTPR